jgi:hypothetical protein
LIYGAYTKEKNKVLCRAEKEQMIAKWKRRVERFSGSISGLIFRYSIPPPLFSLSKFKDNFFSSMRNVYLFKKKCANF